MTYDDKFLNVSGNTLISYSSLIDLYDKNTFIENSRSDFGHIVVSSGTNVTFNNLTIKGTK